MRCKECGASKNEFSWICEYCGNHFQKPAFFPDENDFDILCPSDYDLFEPVDSRDMPTLLKR